MPQADTSLIHSLKKRGIGTAQSDIQDAVILVNHKVVFSLPVKLISWCYIPSEG